MHIMIQYNFKKDPLNLRHHGRMFKYSKMYAYKIFGMLQHDMLMHTQSFNCSYVADIEKNHEKTDTLNSVVRT